VRKRPEVRCYPGLGSASSIGATNYCAGP
jgi:hypothetical protein